MTPPPISELIEEFLETTRSIGTNFPSVDYMQARLMGLDSRADALVGLLYSLRTLLGTHGRISKTDVETIMQRVLRVQLDTLNEVLAKLAPAHPLPSTATAFVDKETTDD